MRSCGMPQRWALPKRKPPSAATRAASLVLGLAIKRAATLAAAARDIARLRRQSATANASLSIFVADAATGARVSLFLFYAVTLLRALLDFEDQASAVR